MIWRAFLLVLAFGGQAMADPVASVRLFWQNGEMQATTSSVDISADSMFAIASVGKTMTAVAILSLVDDGILDLDGAAADLLPLKVVDGLGGMDGITLHHLLTMQSGLPDYYNDAYLEDALDDPARTQQPQIALSYVYGERPLFLPGDGFDYSNTNYVLLGMIAESVTGQTYAALMKSRVFDPAGMKDSFVFGSRPLPAAFVTGLEDGEEVRNYYEGQGFGDGGIVATASDLARFYVALFFDRSLLLPTSLRAMRDDPSGEQYGMGIVTDGHYVGHSGSDLGFSSEVAANLSSRMVAVMLVAQGDADTDWVWDQVTD